MVFNNNFVDLRKNIIMKFYSCDICGELNVIEDLELCVVCKKKYCLMCYKMWCDYCCYCNTKILCKNLTNKRNWFIIFYMYKIKNLLKKCYILLIMTFLPPLIFFLPIISTTFKDGTSEEVFVYNFYDEIKFLGNRTSSNEKNLSTTILITLILCLIFLICFTLIFVFKGQYFHDFQLISTFFCLINLVLSILILIFASRICAYSGAKEMLIETKLRIGGIIFLIYSMSIFIINGLSLIKYFVRRKRNG